MQGGRPSGVHVEDRPQEIKQETGRYTQERHNSLSCFVKERDMKIYGSVTDLIGHTPLLKLNRYMVKNGLGAEIIAKLEYLNPAGSAKDRIARAMIDDAERKGLLKQGGSIVEPTSGNTGIGLASIAAARGYRLILTMPETMSIERRNLLKAYGAELVLTKGEKGMQGAIEKAREIAGNTPDSFMPGQFENPENPKAHINTTAAEIWNDTGGELDIFVAGVGTGGTITGVGEFLKSKDPSIKIVAVEPASSPALSGGSVGKHIIQGIGAGFIPKILDTGIYDEVIGVEDKEASFTVSEIAHTEGILVGLSSGAAVFAAAKLAKQPENKGKRIVVLLPDAGERYLSMNVF